MQFPLTVRRAMTGLAATALLLGLASVGAPAQAAPVTPVFGPSIDAYAANDPQDTCDPSAKPGTVALRNMLNTAYGAHDNHTWRDCSLGGTSEHKEGRALDYMLDYYDTTDRAVAEDILNWLLATDVHGNKHANARRLGIMYLIWNRQIWASSRASEGWRAYSCDGTANDCHTNHIHFSLSWAGANKQTTWWTSAGVSSYGRSAVSGDLGVVRTGTGLLAQYRLGADGFVYGASQDEVGAAYGPWQQIGATGGFADEPTAVIASNATIVVYALGADGKVYGIGQPSPGAAFTTWKTIGTGQPALSSGPSVVLTPSGLLAVYALGADGYVWGSAQSTQGGAFGGWGKIGVTGDIASEPQAFIAPNGTIVLYARGTDGKIRGVGQPSPGAAFGTWSIITSTQPAAGFTTAPTVVSTGDGKLALYATGADGFVWGTAQSTQGGSFGTWIKIGVTGDIASRPQALMAPNNTIVVYARGPDGKIRGVGQPSPGTAFGTWSIIGSGQSTYTGDPSATIALTGEIVVYSVGADGEVWGASQVDPGSAFGGWGQIGS